MNEPKKKKAPKEIDDDTNSRDSRGFEALAELTSSDVVRQVKLGMSHLAPTDDEESDETAPY